MRKFIIKLVIFSFLSYLVGEIIIRYFKLVPDIPQRIIDERGIQKYKHGQSGFYTKAKSKWTVNNYGWLGIAQTDKDTIISVVGDSYIENIMNPISCNQGSILKSHFNKYGFFEAGRSGMTFIEAMEITKYLDLEINPIYHLVYVSTNDFSESLANKKKLTDRVQIDLKSNTVLKAELKNPILKNILYTTKLLYYLYLRFPIFVNSQNKDIDLESSKIAKSFDKDNLKDLFEFCLLNYNVTKIILVFHPGIHQDILLLAKIKGFKIIELNSNEEESWALGNHDGHWSCFGHNQVAQQVKIQFTTILESEE